MTDDKTPILIGVDGGGTGCRVAAGTLADGILAEARGGRANISTDFDVTIASVTAAAHEALAKAGYSGADLPRCVAHLGLAGYTGPEMDAPAIAALPFGRSIVSEDTLTTVVGAIGPRDGYVIALGTGTIIARQKAGQQDYIGGWCFQVSDQASGARLGRAALQSTLLHVDGILPGSNLTKLLLDKLNGPGGIVQFALKALPGDFATLAPEIVMEAKAGDALGVALMREGTAYLEAALNALDYRDGDLLCLAGGVGPHYAEFLPAEMTRNLVEPAGRALDGAFELAGRVSVALG
jgi:glucosamine kinase